MKIKLDENLPATLVGILALLGHDADTVVDEGLKGEPDEVVWPAARMMAAFSLLRIWIFPTSGSLLPAHTAD